jgi:predicted nuclease of restriction endonuclease-like (RecB) superfamily
MELQNRNNDYKHWLEQVKSRIRTARIKASLAANAELISFYWDLGKMMAEVSITAEWGNNWLGRLSNDLRKDFPDMEGFSKTNLYNIKRLYKFYEQDEFFHQLGGKIPWRHHVEIFTKAKSVEEAHFYITQTIENGWSRDVLGFQIKSNLYSRQGKAIHNFKNTLPEPNSDLAGQLLKDPYQFDFLSMTEPYKERELENALVDNVTKFLLELGTGFAYVGKQVPLQVGDQEFFIDLLFYHLKLRAYVVIELKVTDFIPEHAGKLSFYLSVANDILRHPSDNQTIGLLICKNKNDVIAEYSLKNINQPIGISEYQLTKLFPEEFKSSLPTIEEIENELKNAL